MGCRFKVGQITFVADRGMVSRKTIAELEKRDMPYILVDRMRNEKVVRDDVLARPGRFRKVDDTLQVKKVRLDGQRYVICFNPDEAKKDAAERETILASLKEKLKQGAKSLVGNRGYRKYLEVKTGTVSIDRSKVESEARYDGKYVLVTNLPPDFETSDVALRYRELLQVENLFRALKSALRTRPIYHQNESAIKGHNFCNFLALMLLKELQLRLRSKGWKLEWDDIRRDLEALFEVEIEESGHTVYLRTNLVGVCGKVFQAAGVAIPPTVRN